MGIPWAPMIWSSMKVIVEVSSIGLVYKSVCYLFQVKNVLKHRHCTIFIWDEVMWKLLSRYSFLPEPQHNHHRNFVGPLAMLCSNPRFIKSRREIVSIFSLRQSFAEW